MRLTPPREFARAANRMIHRIFLIGVLAFVTAFPLAARDETFPTLSLGDKTLTNVVVLNKTRTDVFISHSKGMVSLKVKELPIDAQLQLGYQVEQPRPSKAKEMLKAADLSRFESDPRVKEMQEKLLTKIREANGQMVQMDPAMKWGVLGGAVLLYLIFCTLCRSICLKAVAPPTSVVGLVWLPLLKQVPLLKAAGMSPWWILTNLLPPLLALTFIVWSFKIARARGKHPMVGVLLLLPVVNILAFLFLAFSASNAPDDHSGVISLQSSPRRQAA